MTEDASHTRGLLVRNVTALTPGKAVPDTCPKTEKGDLEMYEGADDQLPKSPCLNTLRHILSSYHPMSHSTYVLCIPICWQGPIRRVNINFGALSSPKHETRTAPHSFHRKSPLPAGFLSSLSSLSARLGSRLRLDLNPFHLPNECHKAL